MWMKFGRIQPWTEELAALDQLKKIFYFRTIQYILMTCCQVSDRCPLGYLFSILRGSSSLWCLGNVALFCCATFWAVRIMANLVNSGQLKILNFSISLNFSLCLMVFQGSCKYLFALENSVEFVSQLQF